jgi:uroporphyrinogen-III synthase
MKVKRILYLGLDPKRYKTDGSITHLPVIQTFPLPFGDEIQSIFKILHKHTHVLFTSRTAIPIYCEYAHRAKISFSTLKEKIYLCIGQATAQRLREAHLKPHFTAAHETGEGVIELLDSVDLDQCYLFFPHSAQSRPLILDYLVKKKVVCNAVVVYETKSIEIKLPDLKNFDQIVFTSPTTVHSFFRLVQKRPPFEKCCALGPVTKKTLDSYFMDLLS